MNRKSIKLRRFCKYRKMIWDYRRDLKFGVNLKKRNGSFLLFKSPIEREMFFLLVLEYMKGFEEEVGNDVINSIFDEFDTLWETHLSNARNYAFYHVLKAKQKVKNAIVEEKKLTYAAKK